MVRLVVNFSLLVIEESSYGAEYKEHSSFVAIVFFGSTLSITAVLI